MKRDPFAKQFNLLLECIIQWRENAIKGKRKRQQEEKEVVADMFYSQTLTRKHFKLLTRFVANEHQQKETMPVKIVCEFEFGLPIWTSPSFPSTND
mmetsp:Transcript_27968/g.34127  ORF Transcript_27968/g.34127 Transcript_27968/m.34127 type:complete len:96 (-) Transcript_27968:150-437(-)